MSSSAFWSLLCCSFIVLPIPLGFFWVYIYRNRREFDLPDWLSGILAQGIISGHNIDRGTAKEDDYAFIIIATFVSVLTIFCSSVFCLSLLRS